jgi:hypothetical protein
VAENTFNDDGKKNIVYAVPPKPWSEMTEEEKMEMAGQLFDAIKAKQGKFDYKLEQEKLVSLLTGGTGG